MTTDAPKSLKDFASNDRQDIAWLIRQEVWPEVVEGYQDGVKPATIRLWLIRERGFTDKQLPSGDQIARYLRNNHLPEVS